eukprot:GHRQ01012457.1.p1 GENE.GHRQ01012457.1~~GHRQ01012457.1.p1  ORF type:complete len:173 (+),score=53.07 GHRQ01012457.1:1625-2143(+)
MPLRELLVADANEALLSPGVKAGLAVAVVAVVAIAGVMSGLTLGLLSLDRLDLELMMRTGTRRQHTFARRLLPLIASPHWVLSTLVICNTAAGMALPLCLDRLVNVGVALVLSTTAIVLFGEILPQVGCFINILLLCVIARILLTWGFVLCYQLAGARLASSRKACWNAGML